MKPAARRVLRLLALAAGIAFAAGFLLVAGCQTTAGYEEDLTPDSNGAEWIGGAAVSACAADARAAIREHLAREHWCAWCQSRTDLQVHHIRPAAIRPDLVADDRNMITLCRRCHLAVGHPGGDTRKYIANLRELCLARLLCGPGTDAP